MDTTYFGRHRFRKRLNDGLVLLDSDWYGRQVWSEGSTRGYAKECIVTGARPAKGSPMYAPVTNGANRMLRISREGMAQLEKEGPL